MTEHSITNQKQAAAMDDDMEGKSERRGAWWGMLIHRVDGNRVERVLQTKITVEFRLIYFFSASQPN
jgi:hypothetical protein